MAEAMNSAGVGWQATAKRIRVPMGFAFAAVFLLLAHPTIFTLAGSLFLVLPGLWLRAYAGGYVRKNAELTTTGPYAYTRNPLYLGSMLIAFGFAFASASVLIFLLLASLFVAIYVPTIQSEEAYLRANFAGFDVYAARVPRLLPRLISRLPPRSGQDASNHVRGTFSRQLYLKHREYNSAMGAAAIYGVLVLRLFFANHRLF